MAKLKSYNKETGKWEEIISHVNTVVYSGSPTHYTNIETDVPSETEGETLHLNEVINKMESDITTLQGNVAWLAKHGIGGDGGGSQSSTYSIEILNSTSDNTLLVASNPFTIAFRVIGGPSSEMYRYKLIIDGNAVNYSYQTAFIGNVIYAEVKLSDKVSNHNLVLDVLDPNGLNISRKLTVIETSISVSMGNDAQANIPTLSINGNGTVNIYVTNKILNAETTISLTNESVNGQPFLYTYISKSQSETAVPINLFGKDDNSVINTSAAHFKVGSVYSIKVKAQTAVNGVSIESNEISFRATIYGSDDIVTIINRLATVEDDKNNPENTPNFALGEILAFSFRIFLNTTQNIYYAVKVVTKEGDYLVDGKYYDENLKEGDYAFTDNNYAKTQELKTCSWSIPTDLSAQDSVTVGVRTWNYNGTISNETFAKFNITLGNDEIYSNQIPTRLNGGNTLFLSWNKQNANINTPDKWLSYVADYTDAGSSSSIEVNATLNIEHVNNVVSGLLSTPNRHLRLQNNAYAYSNLSEYSELLNNLIQSGANDGFSVSITFETDKHPFNDRTVFLMGVNSNEGELLSGMRIDLERAVWIIPGKNDIKYTLSVNIKQGYKQTIIFNYSKGIAKIFVNGVINAAKDINSFRTDYNFPNEIYLGCNYFNNSRDAYSDANIYNLTICGKGMNDMECVVNSYNNNLGDNTSDESVIAEYKKWKLKNFFITDAENPKVPTSKIFGANGYEVPGFEDIKSSNPPIPVMLINGGIDNSDFNAEFFYNISDSSITAKTFDNFTMQYYDPNGDHSDTIEYTKVSLAIQGTSSTSYRSKNLEIYFRDEIGEGNSKYKLFQPKKDWFPESEFTLKADVVDSSHALNATIGAWINKYASKYMEPNPAMLAVAKNPPRDTYTDKVHTVDSKSSEAIGVKHTLEGFPFILMVNFGGNDLRLLGIYSFNLGRYSHYNMGFKFLKDFTRKETSTSVDKGCPSIVYDYNEYDATTPMEYGEGQYIKQDQIFSFEFGSDADDNSNEHPTWSQDDISILKHIGEFKYNGIERNNETIPNDSIWEKCLKPLFTSVATIGTPEYQTCDKYVWDDVNKAYKKGAGSYTESTDTSSERLISQLSIQNTYAYYTIVMALGLTDSLGKNFTLRTWNGDPDSDAPTRWWPSFYDMDTACGTANDGTENVPVTVHVDKYLNKCIFKYTDDEGIEHETTDYRQIPSDKNGNMYRYTMVVDENAPNTVVVYKNVRDEEGHGFGAYNLRLWNILRTSEARAIITAIYTYERMWRDIRTDLLPTADDFVGLMEDKMGNCGELLYNQDYTEKYITEIEGSYGNITMLHGTRFERIRNWLKDRFYFLDGVFALTSEEAGEALNKFPYYNSGTFYYGGTPSSKYPKLTFNVSSPCILRVITGSNGEPFLYYLEAYNDNVIIMPTLQSDNKETSINNMVLITKIGNLSSNRFQRFGDKLTLPNMSEININGSNQLNGETPINFSEAFVSDGGSFIRLIDLSNTKTAGKSYIVNLKSDEYSYDKVNYIDVSNSNVDSLSLSQSPLSYLNIRNSFVNSITLRDQPFLTGLTFDGCNKLENITIENCGNFTELRVNSLPVISSISINDCENIETIEITDNKLLTNVVITNLPSLKEINLSNCKNPQLNITILNCDSIERMDFSYDKVSSITLPSNVDNVTRLDFTNCTEIASIKYGSEEPEDGVLNLKPFTKLNSEHPGFFLSNARSFSKLRVRNIKDTPFKLYDSLVTNENLTRIYGNISIESNTVFSNCRNFYLNDEVKNSEVTVKPEEGMFVSDDVSTTFCNVSRFPDDMGGAFANTKCNLYDVYYILSRASNVTSLEGTFAYCKNINASVTNPLWDDLFKNCTNVERINMLFYEISGINGPLSSNLLKPLAKITSFDYVFGNGNYTIDNEGNGEAFFAESVSGITSIVNFNPKSGAPGGIGLNYDDNLLSNLTNLESISYSFNNATLELNGSHNQDSDCVLFKNNTKLKVIDNSFNNGNDNRYNLKNLFGGNNEKDENHYPQNLETINKSFNFDNGSNFENIIEETLFKHVKHSIKNVTSSFSHKTIGESGFPYSIFKDCEILENITEFFCGLHSVNTAINNVIDFPNGLFDGCTNLKTIDRLFADISEFKINLHGFGLKNNSIVSLEGLFENSNINTPIPLGLFYQSDSDGNVIKCIRNMSRVFNDSNFNDATYYTKPTESDLAIEDWAIVENMDESLKNDKYSTNIEINSTVITKYNPNFTLEDTSLLNTMNYFCPPDFFYYCDNSNSTLVSNAFAHSYGIIALKDMADDKCRFGKGLLGKIPENLLSPITNVTNIDSLFEGLSSLLPHEWGSYDQTTPGKMYPTNLFNGFSSLLSAKSLFKNTPIWYGTVVTDGLFTPIESTIITLDNLWFGCVFGGALVTGEDADKTIYYQIPETTLENSASLVDVSEMFAQSSIVEIDSLTRVFTPSNMPKLTDVSKLLYKCNSAKGNLPQLWNEGFTLMTTKYLAFAEMSPDKITDYNILKEEHPAFFSDAGYVE